MNLRPLTASRRTTRLLAGTALAIAALAAWAVRHVASSMATWRGHGTQFATIYTVAFAILVWQVCLYSLERPKKTTARQQAQLDRLRVCIPVPLYNEDPGYLHKCLMSILGQTRLPQWVYIVDDGSKVDYTAEKTWFERACAEAGIRMTWQRTENGGKRHAQGHAVRATAGATDVYVTVDSDANLAPDALHELLKPLADPHVQSVAGIVLAENNRKNLLTRVTDLWFVVGQLVDRSALSTMGAVLVNSGVLAAYRAGLVVDNLDGYLSETFFGRRVEFSDDSMLTIYALQRGKAVQQPSAFAFTAMPENLSHHLRQYLRWMRGAFIRTWWRFKYLPLNGYAYWGHFFGWVQMALSTVIFSLLFIVYPAITVHFDPLLLLIPALIGYGQALRYLSFRRSDETLSSQLWTFALAPVALLWSFFVLRVVRWYAMATCLKTGWGTRQHGAEVTTAVTPAPAVEAAEAAATVPLPQAVLPDEEDTVKLPRIPVAKLYDPDTETTLEIALPGR